METYYDHSGESTREEMFLHVKNLMSAGQISAATKVFDDLMKLELGTTQVEIIAPLVLDLKLPPYQQAKKLIKEANAWVAGIDNFTNSKTKYPRPEAVELYQSIPLTLEQLSNIKDEFRHVVYTSRLIYSHPNWETEWVRQNVLPYRLQGYLSGSRNMEFIREIIRGEANNRRPPRRIEIIRGLDNGDHLDERTIIFAVKNGVYTLISHPLYPSVELDAEIKMIEDNQALGYAPRILSNPNITDEQRNRLFEAYAVHGFSDVGEWIVRWKNAPEHFLDQVLEDCKSQIKVRALLAAHPNTSIRALRKLAQSTSAEVKNPAIAQLVKRDKKYKA